MNGETPQLSGGAYLRLVALGAAVGGGHAPLEGIGGGATPVEYVPGRRRSLAAAAAWLAMRVIDAREGEQVEAPAEAGASVASR